MQLPYSVPSSEESLEEAVYKYISANQESENGKGFGLTCAHIHRSLKHHDMPRGKATLKAFVGMVPSMPSLRLEVKAWDGQDVLLIREQTLGKGSFSMGRRANSRRTPYSGHSGTSPEFQILKAQLDSSRCERTAEGGISTPRPLPSWSPLDNATKLLRNVRYDFERGLLAREDLMSNLGKVQQLLDNANTSRSKAF